MKRPDIILITTDTQGREMLSCYGERPGVSTPNLDRFASQNVRFENAFTTCPLCTPARSTWYTGLHPNRSGAWANGMSPHRHVPMLGDLLNESGYGAEHIGKWHLDGIGYYDAGPADGGFCEDAWYDIGAFLDEVGREGPNRFGGWNRGFDDAEYCLAHRVADRAIERIGRDRERPLFLAVEFDEPHGPYICPEPFRGTNHPETVYRPPSLETDLSDKPRLQQEMALHLAEARASADALPGYYAHYYDCNSYVDHEIGRVIEAIDRYLPDAVVIFTSDHGDHLGGFGLGPKGPTMYDLTIGVPLIVRYPGREAAVDDRLVSSTDVWATIVDLVGIDSKPFGVGDGYTGQSLLADESAGRSCVFVEYNRFGTPQDACGGFYPIRCVRTKDWKLSVNLHDKDELYCLREDPHERVNRIDDPDCSGVREELHDRILGWQKQTKDPFRGPEWEARSWRDGDLRSAEGLFPTGFRDHWPNVPFNA